MPNEYESYTYRRYLEPNTENLLGFIVEEAVRQLSGINQRSFMQTELPSFRDRARAIVDAQGPIEVAETVEKNEVKEISLVPVIQ